MPMYKLAITQDGNNFVYPVPDINLISGAKYRQDMQECAVVYPDEIIDPGAIAITQEEYDAYGAVTANSDKPQITGDDTDTATISIAVPSDGTAILLVNGSAAGINPTVSGQTSFPVTADASLVGSVLEIIVESDLWRPSQKLYLEVM